MEEQNNNRGLRRGSRQFEPAEDWELVAVENKTKRVTTEKWENVEKKRIVKSWQIVSAGN